MANPFASLQEKLAEGVRWLLVIGLKPQDSRELLAFSKKQDAGARWLLLDEARSADLRLQWRVEPPRVVVVDGLHCTERADVIGPIKLLLRDFPEQQFLFLLPATFNGIEIPSAYGKGAMLIGDTLQVADVQGRADTELLRHARKLTPTYQKQDLVLGPVTALKFQEALQYIRTKSFVEDQWGFKGRHSRGHGVTVLFHGASGTGKTMAAEVLASELDLPLYQVDLSCLVSKWVGETEKNLRAVFRAAEGVRGILLFDEGDAIFGSRTDVKSSQDRYGNMEVNYLLQEVERFDGVLLLSTNHFNNMDPAFLRRFTYTITFGAPVAAQRRTIWERNLPAELPVADDLDLEHLSQFALTGGNIKNCIRHAAARAASRSSSHVSHEDFLWSIKRELQKYDLDLSREMVGEKYWRKVAPDWEFRQLALSKATREAQKQN